MTLYQEHMMNNWRDGKCTYEMLGFTSFWPLLGARLSDLLSNLHQENNLDLKKPDLTKEMMISSWQSASIANTSHIIKTSLTKESLPEYQNSSFRGIDDGRFCCKPFLLQQRAWIVLGRSGEARLRHRSRSKGSNARNGPHHDIKVSYFVLVLSTATWTARSQW